MTLSPSDYKRREEQYSFTHFVLSRVLLFNVESLETISLDYSAPKFNEMDCHCKQNYIVIFST